MSSYKFNNLVFASIEDANKVLDVINDIFHNFGCITVADLYQAAGMYYIEAVNNYGWIDIQDVQPIFVNGGYTLNLREPRPLYMKDEGPKHDKFVTDDDLENLRACRAFLDKLIARMENENPDNLTDKESD